jgi:hypothetical protein
MGSFPYLLKMPAKAFMFASSWLCSKLSNVNFEWALASICSKITSIHSCLLFFGSAQNFQISILDGLFPLSAQNYNDMVQCLLLPSSAKTSRNPTLNGLFALSAPKKDKKFDVCCFLVLLKML